MMLALEFICDQNGKLIGSKAALDTQLNLAILGLGGGILAKVLHDTFKNVNIKIFLLVRIDFKFLIIF
jgi:hypothetical protein